jgi:hypothetical protein
MAIVQELTSSFDAGTFYREKQVGACEPIVFLLDYQRQAELLAAYDYMPSNRMNHICTAWLCWRLCRALQLKLRVEPTIIIQRTQLLDEPAGGSTMDAAQGGCWKLHGS